MAPSARLHRLERRFAEKASAGSSRRQSASTGAHVAAAISALHDDRFIGPLRETVQAVQALGSRYIIQIGDPGGHTHTGLLSEEEDARSASSGFDFLYGYRNKTIAMTETEIETAIEDFASAARRVRETGSDGVEITGPKATSATSSSKPRKRPTPCGSVTSASIPSTTPCLRERGGRDFLLGVRL